MPDNGIIKLFIIIVKDGIHMSNITLSSKRLYQVSDPLSMITNLDRIASEFIDGGWDVKRGIAGVVILTLQDGKAHFVPSGGGIEEFIFQRRTENE